MIKLLIMVDRQEYTRFDRLVTGLLAEVALSESVFGVHWDRFGIH